METNFNIYFVFLCFCFFSSQFENLRQFSKSKTVFYKVYIIKVLKSIKQFLLFQFVFLIPKCYSYAVFLLRFCLILYKYKKLFFFINTKKQLFILSNFSKICRNQIASCKSILLLKMEIFSSLSLKVRQIHFKTKLKLHLILKVSLLVYIKNIKKSYFMV